MTLFLEQNNVFLDFNFLYGLCGDDRFGCVRRLIEALLYDFGSFGFELEDYGLRLVEGSNVENSRNWKLDGGYFYVTDFDGIKEKIVRRYVVYVSSRGG